MNKEDFVNSLTEEAHECLDQFDYKGAIKILEEGVQKAPEVWVLWQLLGNCYSDEGQYEESYAVYEKALNCLSTDESSIHLNYAIALKRDENYSEALKHLDNVVSKETNLYSRIVRLELLNLSKRYDQTIQLASQLLHEEPKPEDFDNTLPKIYAELGLACWKSTEQAETALEYLWKAIALDKFEETAQWLIREIENQYSPESKYYRMTVAGVWYEPLESDTERPDFLTNYDVVAENEEEMLKFVKRFEPEVIRDSLKIDEVKILRNAPDQPKGVYAVSGYIYFESEDQ